MCCNPCNRGELNSVPWGSFAEAIVDGRSLPAHPSIFCVSVQLPLSPSRRSLPLPRLAPLSHPGHLPLPCAPFSPPPVMSLSTALSLETLTPDELFAASERDLSELWKFYDSNGNGLLEFDEFSTLLTEVINRMAAVLPTLIPIKYCDEHKLDRKVLAGIETKIAAKFAAVNRAELAKTIFETLDTTETATPAPGTQRAARGDATPTGAGAATPAATPATASAAPPSKKHGPSDSVDSLSGFADVVPDGVPVSGVARAGSRGFLEPDQLKPLHSLVEKLFLTDLYASIGNIIVQKQISAMDG